MSDGIKKPEETGAPAAALSTPAPSAEAAAPAVTAPVGKPASPAGPPGEVKTGAPAARQAPRTRTAPTIATGRIGRVGRFSNMITRVSTPYSGYDIYTGDSMMTYDVGGWQYTRYVFANPASLISRRIKGRTEELERQATLAYLADTAQIDVEVAELIRMWAKMGGQMDAFTIVPIDAATFSFRGGERTTICQPNFGVEDTTDKTLRSTSEEQLCLYWYEPTQAVAPGVMEEVFATAEHLMLRFYGQECPLMVGNFATTRKILGVNAANYGMFALPKSWKKIAASGGLTSPYKLLQRMAAKKGTTFGQKPLYARLSQKEAQEIFAIWRACAYVYAYAKYAAAHPVIGDLREFQTQLYLQKLAIDAIRDCAPLLNEKWTFTRAEVGTVDLYVLDQFRRLFTAFDAIGKYYDQYFSHMPVGKKAWVKSYTSDWLLKMDFRGQYNRIQYQFTRDGKSPDVDSGLLVDLSNPAAITAATIQLGEYVCDMFVPTGVINWANGGILDCGWYRTTRDFSELAMQISVPLMPADIRMDSDLATKATIKKASDMWNRMYDTLEYLNPKGPRDASKIDKADELSEFPFYNFIEDLHIPIGGGVKKLRCIPILASVLQMGTGIEMKGQEEGVVIDITGPNDVDVANAAVAAGFLETGVDWNPRDVPRSARPPWRVG